MDDTAGDLDLKPSSANVLRWADGLAGRVGAESTLVHVTTDSQRARRELEAMQRTMGSRADMRIEPSNVIADAAGELSADLLVIGRCSTVGLFGRLEMTAYSIIRQSPCPVVSV